MDSLLTNRAEKMVEYQQHIEYLNQTVVKQKQTIRLHQASMLSQIHKMSELNLMSIHLNEEWLIRKTKYIQMNQVQKIKIIENKLIESNQESLITNTKNAQINQSEKNSSIQTVIKKENTNNNIPVQWMQITKNDVRSMNYTKKNNVFECKYCLNMYPANQQLMRHLEKFHLGTRQWKCVCCSKKFVSESLRNKHQHQHSKLQKLPELPTL